jgi:3-hydroxybutyrate dehydrogenase
MAKNNAHVAIASRNPDRLQSAADEFNKLGLEVLSIAMDVRNKPEVQQGIAQVIAKWQALHIVVNNAGISGLNLMRDPDDSKWQDILATNLNGMYHVTKEALKHIRHHSGGRIINISSVLGKFGVPGYSAYCTTKHGIIGFTRALALEVVDRGITVNAICPGWVDTAMAAEGIRQSAAAQGVSPEHFKAQAVAAVPIRRFLETSEIADLVTFLASDLAQGITGQAINICGGQTMV